MRSCLEGDYGFCCVVGLSKDVHTATNEGDKFPVSHPQQMIFFSKILSL
jgi:hypothetical protein